MKSGRTQASQRVVSTHAPAERCRKRVARRVIGGGRALASATPRLKTALVFPTLLAACTKSTDGPVYEEADQLAAITTFEGVYESDDGSVSTTLCESDDVPLNSCQSAFHIRRTAEDDNVHSGGVGCGGCPFDQVTTGLRAEVIRGGETTRFEGMLSLAVERDHHVAAEIAPPFTLDFATGLDEPHEYVDAEVVVNEDRTLTLTLANEELQLHRVAVIDCWANPIE